MKKSILLSLFLLLSVVIYTQALETPFKQIEKIFSAAFSWEKTVHDFGKIPQGTPVEAVFEFTNTGDAPLIISNAKGSCGCTVPSYTNTPIAPGETGKVKAVFNAAAVGAFNKTITLTANTETATTVLRIKGEVVAKN